MNNSILRRTATHEVRDFLSSQGIELKPWSSLDQTYVGLHELLVRKRDDPAFWTPLREVMENLVESVLNPSTEKRLSAPSAELLSSLNLDDLIQELKETLPKDSNGDSFSLFKQFSTHASASVLAGFLLLGLSVSSCHKTSGSVEDAGSDSDIDSDTDSDSDTDTDTDTDADTDADSDTDTDTDTDTAPWWEGCDLDDTSVLFTVLDTNTTISDIGKHYLCKCFEELNADWTMGLTQLFSVGTPAQIASYLNTISNCCALGDDALFVEEWSSVETAFIDGSLCDVALYMAVRFPEK